MRLSRPPGFPMTLERVVSPPQPPHSPISTHTHKPTLGWCAGRDLKVSPALSSYSWCNKRFKMSLLFGKYYFTSMCTHIRLWSMNDVFLATRTEWPPMRGIIIIYPYRLTLSDFLNPEAVVRGEKVWNANFGTGRRFSVGLTWTPSPWAPSWWDRGSKGRKCEGRGVTTKSCEDNYNERPWGGRLTGVNNRGSSDSTGMGVGG